MQDAQFHKLQGWFETLNTKIDSKIDALDLKLENRFNMVMTALTNLDKRVRDLDKRVRESIDQNNQEIVMIKRVIHDMEQEIKQMKESIHP